MKFFPATRSPAQISGIERTQAPYQLPRWTVCALLGAAYLGGLVTGAIVFGYLVLPPAY